jgi:hypothetical protein
MALVDFVINIIANFFLCAFVALLYIEKAGTQPGLYKIT